MTIPVQERGHHLKRKLHEKTYDESIKALTQVLKVQVEGGILVGADLCTAGRRCGDSSG